MSFVCPFPGGIPFAFAFEGHVESATFASSLTLSMPFGTPTDGRIIIAAVFYQSTSQVVTSCVIGGVTATRIAGNSAACGVAMYWALVPTGTSGNVTFNLSGVAGAWSFATYSVAGWAGASSSANGLSATLNVPAGGVAIGIAGGVSNNTAPS